MSVPQSRTQGSIVLTQGWGSYGRDRSYWRDRDRDSWRRRNRDDGDDWWGWRDSEDGSGEQRSQQSTYRTVCVRLCDGYYWPISYATTPERFHRDSQKCKASCGSPVRLYHGRTGSEIEDMEDQNGQAYRRLKNAFLYRAQYDASCKCKAEPWSKEATDRHKMYALEAARAKGDKVAAQQLNEMRAAQEAERRQAQAAARTDSSAPSAVAASAVAVSNDPSSASDGEDGSRAAHPPSSSGRMSLGAKPPAPPSRSSTRPMRTWAERGDASP